MNNVIYAVIVLGVLGAVFGFVLAFASKVFAIEVDERQAAIAEILPGANCGGCGFAGCSAYAAAVVAGIVELNACAAGGSEVAAKIARIMGAEAGESQRMIALVKCSGRRDITKTKFDYSGVPDCTAAMRLGGNMGPKECPNACIGMGNCAAACKFGAMYMEDGLAHVIREKCVGCKACVNACPKKIIEMVPYTARVNVICANKQKGAEVRKYCEVGCIACKICEKACEFDAIHVVENLAVIDYGKCTNCGACAAKCPRKIILDIGNKVEVAKEA